jgi:hypothetical protein
MNGELFKTELQQELLAILDYWLQHAVDEQQGGFLAASIMTIPPIPTHLRAAC